MPPAIANLIEKIDSRILRERVLIFATLLAVIFLLWNFLIQAGIDRERTELQTQQKQIATEKKNIETQLTAMTMALTMANDPVIVKQNEIQVLQAAIADIESRLAGLSQGLISAEQLPKVLEEVLLRTASVKLLQVRTLGATELQLTAASTAQPSADNTPIGAGVYKHGVLIRVAGTYAQLIQLLQEMENLEWKFYWESLDYSVQQYPNAEVEIRVFTLSSEEGLLGV